MSKVATIPFGKGIYRTSGTGDQGELDECVNLVPSGGGMMNAERKKVISGVTLGKLTTDSAVYWDKLLYVHESADWKHYIVEAKRLTSGIYRRVIGYYYTDSQGSQQLAEIYKVEESSSAVPNSIIIYGVKNVGTILVVLTSVGMKMFMWKDGAYKDYSGSVPMLDMQFALEGEFETRQLLKGIYLCKTNSSSSIVWTIKGTSSGFSLSSISSITNELSVALAYNLRANYQYRFRIYFQNKPIMIRFKSLKIDTTVLDDTLDWAGSEGKSVLYIPTADIETPTIYVSVRAWDVMRNDGGTYSGQVSDLRFEISESSQASGEFTSIWDNEIGYQASMGAVADFVEEKGDRDNKFWRPFFVRYALKMFDGSYIMPSAPCLMIPVMNMTPSMIIERIYDEEEEPTTGQNVKMADAMLSSIFCNLQARCLNTSVISTLINTWGNFIQGVSIAVSSPIDIFDSSKEYKAGKNYGLIEGETDIKNYLASARTCCHINNKSEDGIYEERFMNELLEISTNTRMIKLPMKDDVNEQLGSKGDFYIIKEYQLSEFNTAFSGGTFTNISMPDGTLSNLQSQKAMSDDCQALNVLTPKLAFNYNRCLNIANVKETLFAGYKVALMNGFINRAWYLDGSRYGSISIESGGSYRRRAKVVLNNNGEQLVVSTKYYGAQSGTSSVHYDNLTCHWFYYPSLYATEATLYKEQYQSESHDNKTSHDCVLQRHPMLNGAYWTDFMAPGETSWSTYSDTDPSADARATIDRPNRIYTSEIDNPFVFQQSGISSVNCDRILALSVATKALSQGQFGQYPLYAFTNDGIWALSVGDDRKFSTLQPVSRDVINEGVEPLQTDDAVYFGCDQGLKRLIGSQCELVSMHLNGAVFNNNGWLDTSELVTSTIGYNISTIKLPNNTSTIYINSFIDTLKSCKMLWDYAHRSIVIFPNYRPFYMNLNIDSGELTYRNGTSEANAYAVVTAYPESVLQMQGIASLYTFGKNTNTSSYQGAYMITKKLAFGDPTVLKQIQHIKVLWDKHGSSSQVHITMWGSNDGVNWSRRQSLRGQPWKWYKFCVFSHLTDEDSIQGIICEIEERRLDRIR